MLVLGIIIGIYSLVIFILGLVHLINYISILFVTILFAIILFYLFKRNSVSKQEIKSLYKNKKSIFILFCLIIFSLVNLIGALGPEIAFDATWYHLAIPKIFAQNGKIFFIEGNIFYYSLMPKLTEMLYLSALVLSNEIVSKLIHYLFGIGCVVVTYKISRIYLDNKYSLLAALVFYSNLVVAWLSITAYIDLARAFYEALSLFYFLSFTKNKRVINFLLSSVLLGFAISTKYLSLLAILIYIVLISFFKKTSIGNKVAYSFLMLIIPLFIVSPWLIYSFINTGNPLYPMFTRINSQDPSIFIFSLSNIIYTYTSFFIRAHDPVSPIYLAALPLIILNVKSLYKKSKYLILFFFVSLFILLITPKDGSSRFIVTLLPAYSVVVVLVIKNLNRMFLKRILIGLIFIIFIVNLLYRVIANKRYLGVLIGYLPKEKFLMENLNFSYGDFYDEKGIIKKIVKDDLVLLIGLHNLYYVDFNYTLEDWDNIDKKINYILIQEIDLPKKYLNSDLVYENNKTKVKLFKLKK